MDNHPRPGDRVRDKRSKQCGTVVSAVAWEGEPSDENHGCVEVVMDDGTLDHYVLFGWQRGLEIIPAK